MTGKKEKFPPSSDLAPEAGPAASALGASASASAARLLRFFCSRRRLTRSSRRWCTGTYSSKLSSLDDRFMARRKPSSRDARLPHVTLRH